MYAGLKRSKEDSLPGRAKSSRYIILLTVKRVCRLDQNTVTMALRRVFYSLSLKDHVDSRRLLRAYINQFPLASYQY